MKFLITLVLLLQFTISIEARPAPDFIIIGVQKGGTTSLFSYMAQHPNIGTHIKEIHFFDIKYNRGIQWYKNLFPHKNDTIKLVGEATPSYFFHSDIPRKIARHCPHTKFILLLRNPVERAFSAYKMNVKANREYRSFDEAVKDELFFLTSKDACIRDEALTQDYILSRGIYIDQLKRWMKFFKKEQFLIIKSEDFFKDVAGTLQKVYQFLGIANFPLENYKIKNQSKSKLKMSDETRSKLKEFYKPLNRQLEEYLIREFNLDLNFKWD